MPVGVFDPEDKKKKQKELKAKLHDGVVVVEVSPTKGSSDDRLPRSAAIRRRGQRTEPRISPVAKIDKYNFTVSEIMAFYIRYPEFREKIDSRKYIYIDKKLVLFSEECITIVNGVPKFKLNGRNPDDFCLKKHAFMFSAPGRGPICGAPRPRGLSYEFEDAKFLNSISNLSEGNLPIFFGGGQEPPNNFGDAIIFFMEQRNLTMEKLAELSGLSVKTIQRMRDNDDTNTSIESVISVCVAMQLGPYYTLIMIDKAGCKWNTSSLHKAYFCCVMCSGNSTVEECNNFLIRSGHKPLNNLYDEEATKLFPPIGGIVATKKLNAVLKKNQNKAKDK